MLTLLLTVVIAYASAQIFWLVFMPNLIPTINSIALNQQRATQLNLKNNIFGNKKIVKKSTKKVKESKLNLTVVGILFRQEKSIAIIAPSSALVLAKTYRINDSIKTGVKVKEIGESFVILNRNGKLEKLQYHKKIAGKSLVTQSKKKTEAVRLSEPQKSRINDYRLEIVSNPKKLLSIVGVIPFFKNGKMIGVKVKPNQDKQLFNALGFKSGDIITTINQISIDNFNKFAKIQQTIFNSSSFDLTLKRQNKTVHLNLQL